MSEEMSTELTVLRQTMTDCEFKLSDAAAKVAEAETNVSRLEKELSQWQRYLDYQLRRRAALNAKLRIDREMVRAVEDYNSHIEPM